MTWVAVAVGGASLVGGLLGGDAAQSAANTQAQAAQQAAQMSQAQYQQTRQDLQPYTQAGLVGLGQLQSGQFNQPYTLDMFQQSPAYQFNLQQGQNAINKAAAARQMYYAPQTMQDIARYSQGLASNEFQNAFQNYQQDLGNRWSRIMGLTNIGQTSAAGVGNLGAAAAAQQGGFLTQGANAQAAGQVGMANAINQAIGGGTNALLMNQILQQQQTPIDASFAGMGAAPY